MSIWCLSQKYRRKVFTKAIIQDLHIMFAKICHDFDSQLVEIDGEKDIQLYKSLCGVKVYGQEVILQDLVEERLLSSFVNTLNNKPVQFRIPEEKNKEQVPFFLFRYNSFLRLSPAA